MTDQDVTEESDLETVVGLLDDEHVRSILTATSDEALSANELSELCGVSTSTIYRRIDRLQAEALVHEQTRPRPDGHHETVYVANLERFEVELVDGQLECTLQRRGTDMADQLTRLWENF